MRESERKWEKMGENGENGRKWSYQTPCSETYKATEKSVQSVLGQLPTLIAKSYNNL